MLRVVLRAGLAIHHAASGDGSRSSSTPSHPCRAAAACALIVRNGMSRMASSESRFMSSTSMSSRRYEPAAIRSSNTPASASQAPTCPSRSFADQPSS